MSSESHYVVTVSDRTTLLHGPLGAALMLGGDQTGGRLSLVEHHSGAASARLACPHAPGTCQR